MISCQMENTRPSTGTGSLSNLSLMLEVPSRFVRQWMMVWNGYDGRIYISSGPRLADQAFEPARVLVEKATAQEKNW